MPSTLRLTYAGLALFAVGTVLWAGPLSPPAGPVSSTGKTTQEIFDKAAAAEPRIALNLTNTPGDADSLFKITQAGSYYLTGNATTPNSACIEVTASDVTIDLMGFTLTGSRGVYASTTTTGLTVRNGNVRSTSTGIHAANTDRATVENLNVVATGTAIFLGHQAKVFKCSVTDSGSITTGAFSIVRDCSIRNGTGGISVGRASEVSGCVVAGCNDSGYSVTSWAEGTGIRIFDCIASECKLNSFSFTSGVAIERCTARGGSLKGFDIGDNSSITNSIAQENVGQGLRVGSHCVVTANVIRNNGAASDSAGVWVQGSGNRIDGNDLLNNDWGLWVDGSDNIIVRNTARGNPFGNYNIVGGSNEFATVVTNPGNFATANPFSNFSY